MSERTADYDYDLPSDRIAQNPSPDRDRSRLLYLPLAGGALRHLAFFQLPDLLGPGDLLVANDTAVLPARLLGRRSSGGKVALLVLRALPGRRFEALMRSGRSPSPGDRIEIEGGSGIPVQAVLEERLGAGRWVLGLADIELDRLLSQRGRAPLPPYIRRSTLPEAHDADRERDLSRYQTIYAANPGAIAAPTAGLHFTERVLERLRERGVELAFLTLHVGEGTFRPVTTETPEEHRIAPEEFHIPDATWIAVRRAREEGRRVVAVGTTTCRALETGRRSGSTDLFIRPPYRFEVVSGLVTNFHLPRSSLLMLVAALAGRERVLGAYREAIREGYRFYSYGDAMLVL